MWQIFARCMALLLLQPGCWAQTVTYNGIVKDRDSGTPLAYVNIGVLNRNSGTVTDTEGRFALALGPVHDDETIKISMIGYHSLQLPVSGFKSAVAANPVLYLDKNIAALREVVIPNKRLRTYILGNTPGNKTVSAGFVNNVLGNEIGIIVKTGSKPTFIEAFHAIVDYNHYKNLKFRINVYDLKDGLPNNALLTENIIVSSEVRKGKMTIDLSDYNLLVAEDFFISIELIEGLGEGGLHFIADYTGTPVITRAASQGRWNKQKKLSFGFSVTVKQ